MVQLLFIPQSCTKKTTRGFFAGASVPNGAFASPTVHSEVAQNVIYIPDY